MYSENVIQKNEIHQESVPLRCSWLFYKVPEARPVVNVFPVGMVWSRSRI